MPRRSKGKPASNLHAMLLINLRRLFEKHGMTIKAGMEHGGGSEQLYNQWQNGRTPRLETLELIAEKFNVTVAELLGGARAVFTTAESVEIASYIDDLPEAARAGIAKSVHAQSILYRGGSVQLPPKAVKTES